MRLASSLALCFAAAPAAAEPGVQLDVGGVCDVGPALVSARELLGRDPFDPASAASGQIRTSATADGVTAELTIATPDGRTLGPRTLHAASCEQVSADLAVVIAMAVRTLSPPAPGVPAAPVVRSVSEPTPLERVSPRRWSFDMSAGIAEDGADPDRAHTSGDLGVRARTGRFAFELAFELGAATHLALSNGASVRAQTASFALRPCMVLGPIPVCAIAAAGWTSGDASGVLVSHPGALPVVYGGAGLAYEHHLYGRFAVRVRAETRVDVIGARFDINGMPVTSSPPIEGWLGFDAIAHLP